MRALELLFTTTTESLKKLLSFFLEVVGVRVIRQVAMHDQAHGNPQFEYLKIYQRAIDALLYN